MKLIYLYIKKYKCFVDQEFNFDSNRRFNYDRKQKILNQEEKKILPLDFFYSINQEKESNNQQKERPVTSISAIIGDNGSGKTTLAYFIGEELLQKNSNEKYVVVYEDENKELQIYSTIEGVKCNNYTIQDPKTDLIFGIIPFKFLYFSPFFTSEHYLNIPEDTDLSTSYRLSTGITSLGQRYTNTISLTLDPTIAYVTVEYIQALLFLHDFHKKNVESIQLPKPRGIRIYPEDNLIKVVHSDLIKYRNHFGKNHELYKLYDRIINVIIAKRTDDLFITAFRYYIACYCKDMLSDSIRISKTINDEPTKNIYIQLSNYLQVVEKFNIKLINDESESEDYKKYINDCQSEILNVLRKHDENAYMFFECLKKIYDKYFNIYVPMIIGIECYENQENFDLVLDLVKKYALSVHISNFLNFQFFPKLSSGEMAFLSMYSRIYNFFVKENKNNELNDENTLIYENIIIFLDESETTLHPEWQRQLVNNMIIFLENFAPKYKFHLLFASHSPMLLSDIPKGNVIFLKKNKDKTQNISKNNHETFGSNIYSLYKDSFFLKDMIGKFALDKIQKIFDQLSDIINHESKRK